MNQLRVNARMTLWAALALLYLLFFVWYTDFKGPMTEAEIDSVIEKMTDNGYDKKQIDTIEKFMRSDTGNDFIMVNLLEFNDEPPTLPATGPDADPEQLIGHYMEHMYTAQLKRASHPVFYGETAGDAMEITGIDNAERWTRSALFRYRSRRDIIAMVTDPRFAERHEYKMAALTKTIAVPVEPILFLDFRIAFALALFAFGSIVDLFVYRRRTS